MSSQCPSSKRGYPTQEIAEGALIEARTRFVHNSAVGVYQCEDCGGWHLTSKGEINPRLKQQLESGNLTRNRDASHWEYKLRS